MLAYRMLGIKGNHAEEFEKANVVVKTIRIAKNNKIKENEKVCRIIKLYGLFCYIRYIDHGGW